MKIKFIFTTLLLICTTHLSACRPTPKPEEMIRDFSNNETEQWYSSFEEEMDPHASICQSKRSHCHNRVVFIENTYEEDEEEYIENINTEEDEEEYIENINTKEDEYVDNTDEEEYVENTCQEEEEEMH